MSNDIKHVEVELKRIDDHIRKITLVLNVATAIVLIAVLVPGVLVILNII